MVRSLLDGVNLWDRKSCALPDFSRVGDWDLTEVGHRFASQRFNLEPDFEFPLLGPQFAHRRAGITIDHRATIEGAPLAAKRFVEKENRRGVSIAAAISKDQFFEIFSK